MWQRRSHKLLPLTKLMYIKRIFKWTQVKQGNFYGIKQILARNTLLTCPYLTKNLKFVPMLALSN